MIDPSPANGYPTYRMIIQEDAHITVRFFSRNLCFVTEERLTGATSSAFAAVDFNTKTGSCVFRAPTGGVLGFADDDEEWVAVPEESGFNKVLDVPHLNGRYPNAYKE